VLTNNDVLANIPSVRARVTMVPDLRYPKRPNQARYMPHIVIGDPSQREALKDGNRLTEHYLGVLVTDAPDELCAGQSSEATLVLMYWPAEKYIDVIPGATFTLREGASIVGYGEVLSASAR